MRFPLYHSTLLAICLIGVSCLLPSACSEQASESNPVETPFGKVISATGCKSFQHPADAAGAAQSCVQYRYDAGRRVLELTHENAGFNCCPEEIGADITVDGGLIVISEWERSAPCDCNCLYDVEMLVEHLQPGAYTLSFEEPYRSSDDMELRFAIDLSTEPEGRICVPRTHYPWGM